MKPIFRTAMFGFMKEDVVRFITLQNQEFEKKLKEKDALADDMLQSFEKEKEALSEDSKTLQSLREKLSFQQKYKAELIALKDEFSRTRDAFFASLQKGDEAVGEMKSELECLRERTKDMESLRAKAERFDALAGALSQIVGTTPAAENESDNSKEEKVFFTASPGTAEQSLEEQKEAARALSACFDGILSLLENLDFTAAE